MLFPERESERGGGGGEMASRLPTWKERENNKRRERRRRAISSKIYAGLRMYGGYKLPKHCDNNEVLKALCAEAGWIVEPDGTTYRKGCKPAEPMSVTMGSVSPSPYSSYQPSPCSSYNPSPTSSSFPSPTRAAASSYMAEANIDINYGDLKNRSTTYKLSHPHHPYARNGFSVSAPVTPPLSSPTARTPRINPSWGPLSSPPSPGRQVTVPDPGWLSGFQIPNGGPLSPTFSLVSSNPFAYFKPAADNSSRMCSPIVFRVSDASDEFAFGSNSVSNHDGDGPQGGGGLVKPWEGERIHEECCGPDDHLELTLAL